MYTECLLARRNVTHVYRVFASQADSDCPTPGTHQVLAIPCATLRRFHTSTYITGSPKLSRFIVDADMIDANTDLRPQSLAFGRRQDVNLSLEKIFGQNATA